jgi:Mn-dependent DtxR family transcriptional regulator
MRRSGSWQSVWDDRILEWIRENEGSGTAAEMKKSEYIRVHRTQISRRLQKLAEHGLLQEIGNGAYVITEEGEAYLDEEYDAERGVYMNRDMSNEESSEEADSASDV